MLMISIIIGWYIYKHKSIDDNGDIYDNEDWNNDDYGNDNVNDDANQPTD